MLFARILCLTSSQEEPSLGWPCWEDSQLFVFPKEVLSGKAVKPLAAADAWGGFALPEAPLELSRSGCPNNPYKPQEAPSPRAGCSRHGTAL